MVIDLPAHRARLADDGIGEVGAVRGGGVGDDGERGLERMGEVAGVAPRLLGLHLIMGEKLVQLLRHRLDRSEEHTSELQSLMRISYAVFCLKTKKHKIQTTSYSYP